MTRATRTAAELAAFKAANLAQPVETIIIEPNAKTPRRSKREEYTELLAETRQMIAAANRQGFYHAIPALLQRVETFQQILAAA